MWHLLQFCLNYAAKKYLEYFHTYTLYTFYLLMKESSSDIQHATLALLSVKGSISRASNTVSYSNEHKYMGDYA
jgi:hypothetical protein